MDEGFFLAFDERKGGATPRPKEPESPYFGTSEASWREITAELIASHPLDMQGLTQATLKSWDDIFESIIGFARIGRDIFPNPQIMGFLLHELIPVRIAATAAGWRREAIASEKDLTYDPNLQYSIEIKTSSDRYQIFGNRSFGIPGTGRSKKAKSGYYLAVNFERWRDVSQRRPEITRVRFGWIDSTDWVAQSSQTGQQSMLPARVYNNQLATLYRNS